MGPFWPLFGLSLVNPSWFLQPNFLHTCLIVVVVVVGYNSGKAKKAKRKLKIEALPSPPYSPDLNPLDFSIWAAINSRMAAKTPKKLETAKAYKARLRRTALRLPKSVVRKAILSMPKRIKQVIASEGKNIPRD